MKIFKKNHRKPLIFPPCKQSINTQTSPAQLLVLLWKSNKSEVNPSAPKPWGQEVVNIKGKWNFQYFFKSVNILCILQWIFLISTILNSRNQNLKGASCDFWNICLILFGTHFVCFLLLPHGICTSFCTAFSLSLEEYLKSLKVIQMS